jgi:hypothetical protein
MTEFKASLFDLIDSAAVIEIDGYEIEAAVREWRAQDTPIRRCTCDDDNEWYFADQEVIVRDGVCTVMTAPGDWDTGCGPFEASLEFYVRRSIGPGDVAKPSDPVAATPNDVQRLAWLEMMANRPAGLLLHAGSPKNCEIGLNVAIPGSLRAAIDSVIAMA